MNIVKIAGIDIGTALATGAIVKHVRTSFNNLDFTNPDVCNELNRSYLCDEPANLDKFEKKAVNLNKQYLCSDQDY